MTTKRDTPGAQRLVAGLSIAFVVLLAACDSARDPARETGLAHDLPARPQVTVAPGCTLVAVSPAEPLPPRGDGHGGEGARRAILRHEADCVPGVGPRSSPYLPYRLRFEQEFTEAPMFPGGRLAWVGGEARYVDDSDQPVRRLDAGTDALGKNCAVLLETLETRTVPCVESRDAAAASRFRQALASFRAQNRFTVNVHGDNHLNALRLGRDAACLTYWTRWQGQLDSGLQECVRASGSGSFLPVD